MEQHVKQTQTPTFFIFSDVDEGKYRPDDLEQLIPSHVLYSPLVQILEINSVTKSKMTKCLRNIAEAEGLTRGNKRGARRGRKNGKGGGDGAPSLSAEFYEETHMLSKGDLRHAIFAMQFHCVRRRAAADCALHTPVVGSGNAKKDARLSMFHSLGKLLYAKRDPPQLSGRDFDARWDDGRGPLAFAPDDILSQMDMGTGAALSFVQDHCPHFFTDVADLSCTYACTSDAAMFLDRHHGQDDGPFPTGHASCLGGRAVAAGNRHPAPPRFRQFTAPAAFGVMKKHRENERKIARLRKHLATVGGGEQLRASLHDTIGSAHRFVTDSLPYLRTVVPQGECHKCYSHLLPVMCVPRG